MLKIIIMVTIYFESQALSPDNSFFDMQAIIFVADVCLQVRSLIHLSENV